MGMTELQVWIALVLVGLYVVGKAMAYIASNDSDRRDEARWRAVDTITTCTFEICKSVHAAYVKASGGKLTHEQEADIIARSELYAREEMAFEGHDLHKALSPRRLVRALRGALEDYEASKAKEEAKK